MIMYHNNATNFISNYRDDRWIMVAVIFLLIFNVRDFRRAVYPQKIFRFLFPKINTKEFSQNT